MADDRMVLDPATDVMAERLRQASQAIACIIVVLGTLLILQWFSNPAGTLWLIPSGAQTGLVTPAIMVLFGIGQFTTIRPLAIGGFIIGTALGAAMLLEHLTGIDLRIDISHFVPVAGDESHPGRAALNTCIAVVVLGLGFLVVKMMRLNGTTALIARTLASVGLAIGLTASVGYVLKLQTLYRIASFNTMLPPTAWFVVLSSFQLLLAVRFMTAPVRRTLPQQQRFILRTASTAFAIVAIVAGLTGFSLMRAGFEQSMTANLLLTATTNAVSLEEAVTERLFEAARLASEPNIQDAMLRFRNEPAKARAALAGILALELRPGVNSIEIRDDNETVVASIGRFLHQRATVRHPLPSDEGEVFWNGGYGLYLRKPILLNGSVIGHLLVERRLSGFDQIMRRIRANGVSTDALLCGRQEDVALCAPSRLYPRAFSLPLLRTGGHTTFPIGQALFGETGVTETNDPQGTPVYAAYTPLASLGLGLVVRVNSDEIFEPLHRRANVLVVSLAFLVVIGTLLLRWQIVPLISRIGAEQRRMGIILENSQDAFIAIDPKGNVTDWNAAAEATFGFSAVEAIGRPLTELIISPAFRSAHEHGFERFSVYGTGPLINRRVEITAAHKTGAEIPVEISIAPVRQGNRFAANAFLRDITERRAAEAALQQSRRQLQSVSDNLPAMVARFDRQARYGFANRRVLEATGMTPDELLGRGFAEVHGERFYDALKPSIERVLAGHAAHHEGRFTDLHGQEQWLQSSLMPDLDAEGRVVGFYAMHFDVTERKLTELRQAASEQRLRTIADNLPVLITYVDKEERLRFANGTFRDWLGVAPNEVVGGPLIDMIGPKLYQERERFVKAALAGKRVEFDSRSVSLGVTRDLHSIYIPDIGDHNEVRGFYTLTSDVTALKSVQGQLEHLARNDSLTGLPNRRHLEERLEEDLNRARRMKQPLVLLFMDVDRFKAINDSLGHKAGDEVLKEFGARLKRTIRATDFVARLAGDEFVILAEFMDPDGLDQLAAKILAAFHTPMNISGRSMLVSTSIGSAWSHPGIAPHELLHRADTALYDAKGAGRGMHRSYSEPAEPAAS